jgi:iron complex outermembrane receptor protein
MIRFLTCGFFRLAGRGILAGVAFFPGMGRAAQQLPEYTVRAWHFENETLDIPADIMQIDRETIERSLATSVPDLLETEANLFFSTVSGVTNVSMRGFGEGSGLRSLILIDGQPLNPSDMGRINWEQIPLDSIESIEVLRGGHNVLYGDKALAGVIKIETRRSGETRLNAEGHVASFGTSQGSLSGGIGSELWGVSAGIFRQESDGYRENSASETRNGYVTAGRTFRGGDELDLRLAFGETALSYAGPIGEEAYKNDPASSENLGDEGSENRYATLTARWQGLREWGSWEVLSGYDSNEIDWTFGAGSYGSNEQSGFSLKPRARVETDRLTWVFGSDFLYDSLDFTQYLDEDRRLIPSESELSERRISPFLFAEYGVTDKLTASAGVRYEWVRYEVDSVTYDESQLRPFIETIRGPRPNLNYKASADILPDKSFTEIIHEEGMAAEISLNYRVNEVLSLWLGYDRVYRYPVFDERSAYQGFPLAESVSQDLEAEEGDNFEVGFKYFQDRHEFYATTFFLLMENEIIFNGDVEKIGSLSRGLNVNLGPVRRMGCDLAYHYTADAWGFSVQLAYVQTEQQAGIGRGYEVPLVPDFHTVSQLWWEPVEQLRLRGIHRYVGERYRGGDFINNQPRIEGYHLFDAQAEFDISPNCRVFVKVDNIFDSLYAESVFYGGYYPGDGRSIGIGVKLNF